MGTVTHLGTTWNTTAGAKAVVATPAVGDQIVIIVANSGRTLAQGATSMADSQSGLYSENTQTGNVECTKNTSADSMWVFVRTVLIPSAISTTFTLTPSATDTGGGLSVFSVKGVASIKDAAGNMIATQRRGVLSNQVAGTPVVVLNEAPNPDDACIGAVFTGTNGAANCAPPTGWTEAFDNGYNTPTSGLETCFRSFGETNSTITFGAATPSAYCALVVVIDCTLPKARSNVYQQVLAQAVRYRPRFTFLDGLWRPDRRLVLA